MCSHPESTQSTASGPKRGASNEELPPIFSSAPAAARAYAASRESTSSSRPDGGLFAEQMHQLGRLQVILRAQSLWDRLANAHATA